MTEPTDQKQIPGRFKPGESGNPKGRAKGSRNTALVALDALGTDAAQDLLRSVIEKAKEGDTRAACVILDRVWPVRKGRLLTFDMPRVESAADVARAVGGILEAVAGGLLTIEEGQGLASILESQRKALELTEIEERLTLLENQRGNKP